MGLTLDVRPSHRDRPSVLTFLSIYRYLTGVLTSGSLSEYIQESVPSFSNIMLWILGPEMGFGNHQTARRTLRSRFSSNKLKEQIQPIHPSPDHPKHWTLGSIFSTNYDSVKSSVKRATSVRVTKRERKIVRAQDIFPSDLER